MQTISHNLWWPRGVTFLLALAAGLSAGFWVLKGTGSDSASMAAPAALVGTAPSLDPQVLALALGGGKQAVRPDAPPTSSRYVLAGVVADRSSGGAALIAVDGKAAKAVRVGAIVEGDLVLQSVSGRRAILGTGVNGPATVTLEMAALAK